MCRGLRLSTTALYCDDLGDQARVCDTDRLDLPSGARYTHRQVVEGPGAEPLECLNSLRGRSWL